ncbi:hypothetical protein [Vibrio cyclitrophicus]|uniref:hypothetical protein n=1 Tax=Vibrio cyclitrophicus TaxID=47951 RepID=UPI00037EA505|nr:hypothetical protein [Vibrio cyclitrophicus]NOH20095.1 hypothetical protein [Vibrio cyclitrophicus]OEE19124.1 hypothetical protein OC1_21280 [Vibrio cyclitrophicus ZF207]
MNISIKALKNLFSKKKTRPTQKELDNCRVLLMPLSYTSPMQEERKKLQSQRKIKRDWENVENEALQYLMQSGIEDPTPKQCRQALIKAIKKPLYPDL